MATSKARAATETVGATEATERLENALTDFNGTIDTYADPASVRTALDALCRAAAVYANAMGFGAAEALRLTKTARERADDYVRQYGRDD